jgi:hypothetical protein
MKWRWRSWATVRFPARRRQWPRRPPDVGGANPGQDDGWGQTGTREKPSGLAIVNLRTRQMKIVGQTPEGSGLWHVHGSSDGRWAVGDDFSRSVYLIDRRTREMMTAHHRPQDHRRRPPAPDLQRRRHKIEIQSAMLSEDGRTMNIAIVPVPEGLAEAEVMRNASVQRRELARCAARRARPRAGSRSGRTRAGALTRFCATPLTVTSITPSRLVMSALFHSPAGVRCRRRYGLDRRDRRRVRW